MKYFSTRCAKPQPSLLATPVHGITFKQALLQGLAADGGLYVPESIPFFKLSAWSIDLSIAQLAKIILPLWMNDADGDFLPAKKLHTLCESAFNFPTPVQLFNDRPSFLELYHGPTAAFKDVGARFLAECLSHIDCLTKPLVLVATSGDTGGAVAAAFYDKPGIAVVILYPKNKVSKRQELQLTTWGKNVHALSVRGTFDDCQRLVKGYLQQSIHSRQTLLTANSINLGRLLPQTLYYAQSSLTYFYQRKKWPGYIIPTGNLGNALAALWAKKMGFPIREVVLATNANLSIVEYFNSGTWSPQPTVATLANAMDVGNPSNIERLRHLYPDFTTLCQEVCAISVSDAQIRNAIELAHQAWNVVVCPHTATAVAAWRQMMQPKDWILVATAHPAKFDTIVEPLVHRQLHIPPSLNAMLSRDEIKTEIEPELDTLTAALSAYGLIA